jgi:hypothetical protein
MTRPLGLLQVVVLVYSMRLKDSVPVEPAVCPLL